MINYKMNSLPKAFIQKSVDMAIKDIISKHVDETIDDLKTKVLAALPLIETKVYESMESFGMAPKLEVDMTIRDETK